MFRFFIKYCMFFWVIFIIVFRVLDVFLGEGVGHGGIYMSSILSLYVIPISVFLFCCNIYYAVKIIESTYIFRNLVVLFFIFSIAIPIIFMLDSY
jgi:hypothetical protein